MFSAGQFLPNYITVGGRVFTDVDNLIILIATIQGTTGYRSTFRKTNETAGYKPSGSNKFNVLALKSWIVQGASIAKLGIGYADNDVGMASTTAFTNDFPMGYTNDGFDIGAWGNYYGQEYPLYFQIPNGKYPRLATTSATEAIANVVLYGYEVP